MSILEEVIAIIKDNLDLENDNISEDTNLKNDLHADSIDAMQIIMDLEDKYNIQIPTEETANIQTVKDLVNYVEKNIE